MGNETYGAIVRDSRPKRDIAAQQREFDKRYQEFKELRSQRAKDRANEEMVQIEAEINSLQGQLDPLVEELGITYRECKRMMAAVDLCRQVMKDGSDRRKAEAVKGVVSEVVCYFKYADLKATSAPKSSLEHVEIIPRVGEPWECFPEGNTPGPG